MANKFAVSHANEVLHNLGCDNILGYWHRDKNKRGK